MPVAKQADGHGKAALGQKPRRDKTVAAVVAGATEHRNMRLRQMLADEAGCRLRNGVAGPLHQYGAGLAVFRRQPINDRHLARQQQFDRKPLAAQRDFGGG